MAAFDTKAEVPGRQLGFMETASGKLADVRYWPKAAALCPLLPPIATANADFRKRSCLLRPRIWQCASPCLLWAKSELRQPCCNAH